MDSSYPAVSTIISNLSGSRGQDVPRFIKIFLFAFTPSPKSDTQCNISANNSPKNAHTGSYGSPTSLSGKSPNYTTHGGIDR